MSTATSAKANFTAFARSKAFLTAFGFLVWGTILAKLVITSWHTAWPLVLFYLLILLNTYFSVRAFSTITPVRYWPQQVIDLLLGAWLAILPFNFERPFYFVLAMMGLFISATLKYILLVPVTGYSKLFYMKIRVDTLGISFCFLALLGVLYGYAYWTTVTWACIFLLANVYVLWVNPHYHLDLHRQGTF